MVGCYWHFPRVFFWSIIDLDGKDGHKSAAPVEQSDFQRIKLQPAEWCDSLIPMRFTQRFRFEQHTPFHVLVEHDFFHLPNNVWQYWIKWHFCDCTFMVSWSIAIWQSVTVHVQIHQHITYITTLSFHFGSKHFLKTWSMDEVRDAWSGYVHGNHPDSFVAREHPGPSWTILDPFELTPNGTKPQRGGCGCWHVYSGRQGSLSADVQKGSKRWVLIVLIVLNYWSEKMWLAVLLALNQRRYRSLSTRLSLPATQVWRYKRSRLRNGRCHLDYFDLNISL